MQHPKTPNLQLEYELARSHILTSNLQQKKKRVMKRMKTAYMTYKKIRPSFDSDRYAQKAPELAMHRHGKWAECLESMEMSKNGKDDKVKGEKGTTHFKVCFHLWYAETTVQFLKMKEPSFYTFEGPFTHLLGSSNASVY